MLELVRGIKDVNQRDPHFRWKAVQVFCEHQRFKEARKVLQGIVDDEQVAPPLRQRANEVLDQLDDIRAQQFQQRRARSQVPPITDLRKKGIGRTDRAR